MLATNPDGTARSAIAAGQFLGNIIDFVIIAAAVFLITKALIKPEAAAPAEPTRVCPECQQTIALKAKRCMYCTAAV